jgi:hypothetical protein
VQQEASVFGGFNAKKLSKHMLDCHNADRENVKQKWIDKVSELRTVAF